MTPAAFRKLALSMPEAVEKAHMGHPDFRVGGRVFATLFTRDGEWGMVRVTPPKQRRLMRSHPGVFKPAAGAWGRQGCTLVDLGVAEPSVVREALAEAWRTVAPKQAVEIYGKKSPRATASSRGDPGERATRRTTPRTRAVRHRK